MTSQSSNVMSFNEFSAKYIVIVYENMVNNKNQVCYELGS